MAKGIYGWKLVGSYLLFAVWVNSWLPLTMAISYYMQQTFTDKLAEVLSLVQVSGMKGAVYSPTLINAVLDGAQDTIATASVFMSTVPMLMFAILSGSAYGFVHLAQRAAMTGKDFVDESRVAPKALEDANLGVQQAISAMSRGGPISSTNATDLGNGFFDKAAINSPVKMSIDNATGVAEQYSDAISHSQQAIEDYSNGTIHLAQIQDGKVVSSGDVLQVQDGKVVGIKHMEAGETANTVSNDGTVSIYAGADGKATASVSAANKMYVKEEVSAGLSTPIGGAKVAAGAEQSFTTQGTLEGSVGAGMRGQESWGTSANVSIKSGDTAERAMNSTETIGSNSSIMVNGQKIDSHSMQQAMTQRIAEEQNKVASYQHSMNTMASQSMRADVSWNDFANVGFENYRTQMNKGVEAVQQLAESHNELRFHAGQLAFLAEKGNLQDYAAKVQELWANPETRMAGNAALGAYFDGISGTQNIADVAQSALNAQLKAEQEIGAKHGDYDKEINVKENVVGNFANPIDPVKVQSDLTQQFNDSPLMQKVSHNISNAQTNTEQEKQAMSEQVSGSLKDNGQPEKHSQNNQTIQTADNAVKSSEVSGSLNKLPTDHLPKGVRRVSVKDLSDNQPKSPDNLLYNAEMCNALQKIADQKDNDWVTGKNKYRPFYIRTAFAEKVEYADYPNDETEFLKKQAKVPLEVNGVDLQYMIMENRLARSSGLMPKFATSRVNEFLLNSYSMTVGNFNNIKDHYTKNKDLKAAVKSAWGEFGTDVAGTRMGREAAKFKDFQSFVDAKCHKPNKDKK